jgi:hypothetical protein
MRSTEPGNPVPVGDDRPHADVDWPSGLWVDRADAGLCAVEPTTSVAFQSRCRRPLLASLPGMRDVLTCCAMAP